MSVIDPVRHERLLQGLKGYAETAGIPPNFVHKSATEYLTPRELQWMKTYPERKLNGQGLCLTDVHKPDPATKMMAMTAAFLRNFIDARMMPVNTVLDIVQDGRVPECEVLLIPNLFQSAYGKAFQAYKVQALYDLLLGRLAKGLVTVVYVQKMGELEAEFGTLFKAHLDTYVQSKGAVI